MTMATHSWKYEDGEYNLQELCKKHPPPVIVQCNNEIGEVTYDNTTFDLSKPILLYRQRNINKVTAKIIHWEIYRDVGPPLLIPEDYKGWFAVLQKKQIKPGTLRQDILEFKLVAELSNSNTQTFLIGGTEKVNALQVTTFSDGKYQHQQRSLFPGEVLRRGKIYIGERKKKSAIFRRQKTKQDYYLLCTDECDREILLPFAQKGLFYAITTENGRMACPVLQMKDLLDKKYLPATVKLLYGKLPNLSVECTDTLRLEDSHFERSVIACTVSDRNDFNELPLTCSLKFRIYDMDEAIISSALYKRAFATCNEKVHVYMRGIKVCHEFGELNVMSEEEKFDNEMPPNPHILRKRKPLDSEIEDNRESGYIEMRPESFEFTKDYIYTDMNQSGIPDSEIDLDDMDYVVPPPLNAHDSVRRSQSCKTPLVDRQYSFSPPPTTPPPPLPHACTGTLPRTFHTYIDLDSGHSDGHVSGSFVRSRSRIEKAHMDQIYDIPRIPKRQSAPDEFETFQTNVSSVVSMPILSESSQGEAIKYENFSILREVVPKPCGKNRTSQRKPAESFQYDPPQYDSPQNLDVARARSFDAHNSSSDSEGCSADSQYYFEELIASKQEVNYKDFQSEIERDFSDNRFKDNGTNVHTSTGDVQNGNSVLSDAGLGNLNYTYNNKAKESTNVGQTEETSFVNNDNESSNNDLIHRLYSSQTLVADDKDIEDETNLDEDIDDANQTSSFQNDIEDGETIPGDSPSNLNGISLIEQSNNENIEMLIATNEEDSKEEFHNDQHHCKFFLSLENEPDKSDDLFKDEISTNTLGNIADITSHIHCEDEIVVTFEGNDTGTKFLDTDLVKSQKSNTQYHILNSIHDKTCSNEDSSLHNNENDIESTEPTRTERYYFPENGLIGQTEDDFDVNECLPKAHIITNDDLSYVNLNNTEVDLTVEKDRETIEKTPSFDRLDSIEDELLNVAPPPCTGFYKIYNDTALINTLKLEVNKENIETTDNQKPNTNVNKSMDNYNVTTSAMGENPETANSEDASTSELNNENPEITDNQDVLTSASECEYPEIDKSTSVAKNETLIERQEDENPYVNTALNMETEHLETAREDTYDNIVGTGDLHSDTEQSNTSMQIPTETCDPVSKHVNIEYYGDINFSFDKKDSDEIPTECAEIKEILTDEKDCSNIDQDISPNDKISYSQEIESAENYNRSQTDIGDRISSLVAIDDDLSTEEVNNSKIYGNRETGEENELSRMSTDDIVNEFRKLGVRKNIINTVKENRLIGLNFTNVQKLGGILPGLSVIDKRKISMFLQTALSRKITSSHQKTEIDPLEPLWV